MTWKRRLRHETRLVRGRQARPASLEFDNSAGRGPGRGLVRVEKYTRGTGAHRATGALTHPDSSAGMLTTQPKSQERLLWGGDEGGGGARERDRERLQGATFKAALPLTPHADGGGARNPRTMRARGGAAGIGLNNKVSRTGPARGNGTPSSTGDCLSLCASKLYHRPGWAR
jgi:hypothetical protein